MMKFFHFVLSHSIFIALCAAGLSLQTLQLLRLTVNGNLLALIFFATLCGYNAYWIVSRFSFSKHRPFLVFLQKSKSSFFVMATALIGMVYSMTRLQLVMYYIVITFMLLIFYAVPVMPFKQLHFARKAGFVKTILLAFTWAFVTILIPLQAPVQELGRTAWLIFINRFLFMLMLCIIFDKRDAGVDKIRGLQSLATDTKPILLHYLMGIILAGYTGISYSMLGYGIPGAQVTALVLAGLVAGSLYIISFKPRGYLFYYFLVDGLMFLSAALTALASAWTI